MQDTSSAHKRTGGVSKTALAEIRPKLVSADKLRTFFDPPVSLRWVRLMTKRRMLPSIKIGHLVFYNPDAVLESLAQRNTIKARV